MNAEYVSENAKKISDNIKKVIVGRDSQIEKILAALLAGGSVLIEDVPGTGKTKLAKALAYSIDGTFKRIQFTPDLLPADVTGLSVYNQKTGEFSFNKGPVFTNILLADEINRATPRTQSGLLESMEEKQVTADGETYELPKLFFTVATENPVETAGTYPLPEALLDRFSLKISMGKMTADEGLEMIDRFIEEDPIDSLTPVCDTETVISMQSEIRKVFVNKCVRGYISEITENVSSSRELSSGISPRAMLTLVRVCQAVAAINGRDFVTPDDVKTVCREVYAHRLEPFANSRNDSVYDIIDNALNAVAVPTEDFVRK
ncbi:MAG: AAA family ATPase [Lachnospiraceae bacterium]|nr:AAA family ATPase [Lachnospiraceae bacterium]